MLAFSEIIKSFSPVRSIGGHIQSLKKFVVEKFIDLILIVISIYIALNVEKIAEHSSDKEKLHQYYVNLEKEITLDLNSLDTCRLTTEKNLKQEGSLIKMLSNYSPALKDSITASMLNAISLQLFLNSEMLSYKSMMLSGDIKLIKNLKVKEKLIELEGKYSSIKIYEDYVLDFIKKDLTAILHDNYDISAKQDQLKNEKLYTDYRFKNSIVFFYGLNAQRIKQYHDAIETAKETQVVIREELKGKE